MNSTGENSDSGGHEFIDVTRILPPFLPSGKRIIWKELGDGMIEIFCDRYGVRGGNPKPVKIRRFVPINEDLFTLFGLWLGDGNRLREGEWRAFGFANTEIELHKIFFRMVENALGIKREEFFIDISTTAELEYNIEAIKRSVANEISIPLKNFWTGSANKTRNFTHIDSRINSRLLSTLMKLLSDHFKPIAITNRNFAAGMLKGLIASEANVYVRKEGNLGEIFIAAKGEDKRELIRKLLICLGIKPSKDKTIESQECVLIHGQSNFKKVGELNLTILHPKKHKDFEKGLGGFRREEFRKGEGKTLILGILYEHNQLKAKEIAKLVGRSRTTVVDEHLTPLQKSGFVESQKIGRLVFWNITERGKKILNDPDAMKRLRHRNNGFTLL